MIRFIEKIFGKRNNQAVYKTGHSIGFVDDKIKKTWTYNLMDLLKNARNGDSKDLKILLAKYSPLAAANEDYTILILFRHFHVNTGSELTVLNCHPQNEDFQCGITIVTSSEDGESLSNIYLPNDYNYKELRIKGKEIEIITNKKTVRTNINELFQKLQFWTKFTLKDIEDAFNNLCNHQYEEPERIEVLNRKINIEHIGELIYNDKYEWYEGEIEIDKKSIKLNITLTTSEELGKLIAFVDKQMKLMFYKNAFMEIESEMVRQKNELWLDMDLDNIEKELPISVEEFRKRISIESIVFHDDCSSSIYCFDDNVFGGHTIIINVDASGKYLDSNLAG